MDDNFRKLFEVTQPWSHVFTSAEMAYIALKGPEGGKKEATILRARIKLLRASEAEVEEISVDTLHLLAGRKRINFGQDDLSRIAESDSAGAFQVLDDIFFSGAGTTPPFNYSFDLYAHQYKTRDAVPLSPSVLISGTYRAPLLPARGVTDLSLDWELKSSHQPYASLQELIEVLDLHIPFGFTENATQLQIVAPSPASVVPSSSFVDGKAAIEIRIDPTLSRERLFVGYRVFAPDGAIQERGRVAPESVHWANMKGASTARCTIIAPEAGSIHVHLTFCGTSLHDFEAIDPNRFPNARLAAYATMDPDLAILRKMFFNPHEALRDLENATVTLFTLLGFAAMPIDGLPKSNDFIDVMAFAPDGNCLVIECTTRRINNKDKADKVKQRALQVQGKIREATRTELRPRALMLTTLPREEIASQIADAAENNISVLCKEDIEQALRTVGLKPDANAIFRRLTQAPIPFMDPEPVF